MIFVAALNINDILVKCTELCYIVFIYNKMLDERHIYAFYLTKLDNNPRNICCLFIYYDFSIDILVQLPYSSLCYTIDVPSILFQQKPNSNRNPIWPPLKNRRNHSSVYSIGNRLL